MKLTNYIIELGRPVAYYPKLKRITGSTTATILLCQLLYWSDKTGNKNGWIYKDSYDLEEETGLTYYEQKTARRTLISKGLVREEHQRLNHTFGFKINEDALNEAWEEETQKKSQKVAPKSKYISDDETQMSMFESDEDADEVKPIVPKPVPQKPIPIVSASPVPERERRTDAVVKGNMADGIIHYSQTEAFRKTKRLMEIRDTLERRFTINCQDAKWNSFIDFAYSQEKNSKRSVDKFIDWALVNGFHPAYWSPEKMKTLYPQAFAKPETGVYREDFVQEPEKEQEKEIAPMPKELLKKKKLD